jgi:hypothetical protein
MGYKTIDPCKYETEIIREMPEANFTGILQSNSHT